MATLRLALEYFHPWTNDAGYQIAQDAGWYGESDLDVRQVLLDPLFGDSLDHLVAGEVDLAVAPTNRVFVRREAGEPVVAVAAVNHRGMETIQALRSSGIERPRDLESRRVALNPTPRGVAMVRHLVAADGGDPDAVVIVDSGSREVNVDDLVEGFADAFFGGYWAWDAMFGSVPDDERVTWPVDQIGAPPYHSYVIVTHDRFVDERSAELSSFLDATELGFRAARDDPSSALSVLRRTIPYVHPAHLERSLELLAPTWFHDDVWGAQREELHAPYAAWLTEHDILADPEIWRQATTAVARSATPKAATSGALSLAR